MIDENRILKNLKEFSFPRLSGTELEKKSFNIAKKKIEELNLNPIVQEFLFSTFYSRLYPKISLALFNWFLFIIFLNFHVIFNIINMVILFILILIMIILTRKPEKIKFGRKYRSQNVFVKLSSQHNNESSENNIFLFSHLDSKGQVFSIKIRIRLYFIWIISYPLSLILNILVSFYMLHLYLFLYILSILILAVNCIATIMIWLNTTNNKSVGAR